MRLKGDNFTPFKGSSRTNKVVSSGLMSPALLATETRCWQDLYSLEVKVFYFLDGSPGSFCVKKEWDSQMDWFSLDFFLALFSIVIIDLVLAGDNAIVIGMAARNLPKKQQKQAIVWGTLGAIIIRSLATLFVVWLLKIPGLLLIGGILLIWIAYKLLVEKKGGHDSSVQAGTTMFSAIRTIIIADTVMSLDNVLAIAGAAHGHFFLVIMGLLISVPIIVWGSSLFIKLADRFPIIIYLGGGVLAWTAAKMITDEKLLQSWMDEPLLKWGIIVLIIAGILAAGTMKNRKTAATEDAA